MKTNRKRVDGQREFIFVIDTQAHAIKRETIERRGTLNASTFSEGELMALKQKLVRQLKENGS